MRRDDGHPGHLPVMDGDAVVGIVSLRDLWNAYRNGYRTRTWDTRVGTIELKIPKVTAGSYFPSLLEPRRRAEKALHAVVVEAYVKGISTRKVDDLVRALGIDGISRSEGLPDLQGARRGREGLPRPSARR